MKDMFDPNHPIIKLCMKGLALLESQNREEAHSCFEKAYGEAEGNMEKFLAAYFLSKTQIQPRERASYLQCALAHAQLIDNPAAQSGLSSLYAELAAVYSALAETTKAPQDSGPFYHGTRAKLKAGDLLVPGHRSNYQSDLKMNHIYFTATLNGAALAAALAAGDGESRVYLVKPLGDFENDPNVTNQKFPGNPTRSYRSTKALEIIGEVSDWERIDPAVIKAWREKLSEGRGEIIN